MPTAQLLDGNQKKRNAKLVRRIRERGRRSKTRRRQVQTSSIRSIWLCIWRKFHADEPYYSKSIKEEYQSAWMFTYSLLWIWIPFWALGQWTKDLKWDAMDLKAPAAIDYNLSR